MKRTPPRIAQGPLLVCFVIGLGVAALSLPATTRQGVNFEVSTHRLPLYVKLTDFFHRHYHYQLLARDITRGRHTDRERVEAVYQWTRQHIQPPPRGWTIVDDHVLNIIIRGYGTGDQAADVFTTLCAYAGVPAFWRALHIDQGSRWLILSFAQVDEQWVMFDVYYGIIFTDADGQWADAEALIEEPERLRAAGDPTTPQRIAYRRYLDRLRPFRAPATLRAEKQMPWPRVKFEIASRLGLERREP